MMVKKKVSNYRASFDAHNNTLCTKISKSLFCMNRVKKFATKNVLLCHGAVVGALSLKLLHKCLFLCECSSLHRRKLKQKEAIRIVCNAGYRHNKTNQLFKQIGIVPPENLIKYSNLKFMHNYVHGKLHFSFYETWVTNRARNPNLEFAKC